MYLYVLKYNNYYNRIIKKKNSLEEYSQFVIYGPVAGVYGFTPGDGVNTTQILGTSLQMYSGSGDYLIAVDEESNEINSRWFIIDTKRERNGQWTLTLHRDLIADYYADILESTMFVEKCNLPIDSPFIFNKEQMTLNQIKTKEYLMRDKTNCPWLVGYYAKNKQNELVGTVPINSLTSIPSIPLATPIANWDYYKYTSEMLYAKPSKVFWLFYGSNVNSGNSGYVSIQHPNNYSWNNWAVISNNSSLNFNNKSINLYTGPHLAAQVDNRKTALFNEIINYIPYSTDDELDDFLSYNGKVVSDSNGKYFKVTITSTNNLVTKSEYITAGSLFEELTSVVRATGDISGNPNNESFKLITHNQAYQMTLTELSYLETTYDLSSGDKLITTDSPWGIFAIPYGKIVVKNEDNDETLITTSEEIGIATAMGMQSQQPGNIYDIQLLPYCPIQDLITNDGEITVTNSKQYSFVKSPDPNNPSEQTINTGIIFNVPLSKFSFDLIDFDGKQEILNNIEMVGQTAIEKKVNSECNKWRLASPNYSNYFDFSVEKNNGIEYFNVDCEYKPFTPYIHINPNFSGLYGYDDNSPRGLILGGDFSLSQIINQWEQYQIQNKNFQLTFDRQIQNMEINQAYQKTGDIISTITGSLTGLTSGAFAGSAMSPGTGGLPGGIVGGIASTVAGIGDIAINESLRNEALDYTKDLFGYSLGNIQALPNTISKVSAYNPNNKVFPVLEFYTCTKEEKIALLNKLAWNGMTTMVIGKVDDYLGNNWSYEISRNDTDNTILITSKGYIKGQLIRLENNIEEDFHIVNSISGELLKGVYITQEEM